MIEKSIEAYIALADRLKDREFVGQITEAAGMVHEALKNGGKVEAQLSPS